jgi:hypothetical protein
MRFRSSLRRSPAVFGAGALVVAVVATVGANGPATRNEAWPTADSPIFAGLPAAVVAEVLANPKAQANIRIVPPEDTARRATLWQGMVTDFVQCRALLGVYRTWTATGKAPQAPASLVPTTPTEDTLRESQIVDSFYRSEIASGDIRRLRSDLLNESGCGVWIPATPGDVTGPTIADVVRG